MMHIMKMKIYILIFTAFCNSRMYSQISCNDMYGIIHKLENNSNSIVFNDESISLNKRIRKSKHMAIQALKIAYSTIDYDMCNNHDYSIIVDRIIDLELQFGNKKKANKIALERLEKLNPNWKNKASSVSPEHLTVLSRISSFKPSESFYKLVKKNKYYFACGTTTYEQDVSTLLWQAEQLYENYGKIYCYKLLQNSVILINEDNERAKPIWDNIYDLLINSISDHESFEQIVTNYEKSPITELSNENWEYLNWDYSFKKSKYYFELSGLKIYFKTESCPDTSNQLKRCEPSNLELIKSKSELLKRIKRYAS